MCKQCKPYIDKYLEVGTTANENHVPDLECHHHEMHSDLNRLQREQELEEKMNAIIDLDKIDQEITVCYDKDPLHAQDNSKRNTSSLHYEPIE